MSPGDADSDSDRLGTVNSVNERLCDATRTVFENNVLLGRFVSCDICIFYSVSNI